MSSSLSSLSEFWNQETFLVFQKLSSDPHRSNKITKEIAINVLIRIQRCSCCNKSPEFSRALQSGEKRTLFCQKMPIEGFRGSKAVKCLAR